jgi:hypothetical protein
LDLDGGLRLIQKNLRRMRTFQRNTLQINALNTENGLRFVSLIGGLLALCVAHDGTSFKELLRKDGCPRAARAAKV